MKRPKVVYQTRSARQRRQALLRAGIWIFLCIFAFSVVGAVIAFGTAPR
ncbi:MAG: hypothetical protein ACYDG0_02935 [Vulcanimicrobiaceae bacterium]|nr:hypothetical protein [Bacillota bacterium]